MTSKLWGGLATLLSLLKMPSSRQRSVVVIGSAMFLASLYRDALARPPLDASDIPTLRSSADEDFNHNQQGRLFTSKLFVNDITPQSDFYAIGFNSGNGETFPPISCKIFDRGEALLARKGEELWVSGILADKMGSTIFLEPCEISLTREPWNDPQPWKKHPPKE